MSTLVVLLSKNCVCALVMSTLLNSTSPSSKDRVLPDVVVQILFPGIVSRT